MPDSEKTVLYTSHPIDKLKLGKHQFVKGVLRLTPEEAEEFDQRLAKHPPQVQARVKKCSVEAAEKIAKQFKAGSMTQGVDTTANSVVTGAQQSAEVRVPEDSQATQEPPADEDKKPGLQFGTRTAG